MTEDQAIISEMSKLLWSAFPENLKEIVFQAFLYEDWPMHSYYTVDDTDTVVAFAKGKHPDEQMARVMELSKKLALAPAFKKEPFNHIRISLNNDKKIKLDFAYINREDSWIGLFMRAVSDLTAEEAVKKYYIPKHEWEKRVEKFKT